MSNPFDHTIGLPDYSTPEEHARKLKAMKPTTINDIAPGVYAAGFRAGAEAMRESAIKLRNSPDVIEIEEYADCIRALPLPDQK